MQKIRTPEEKQSQTNLESGCFQIASRDNVITKMVGKTPYSSRQQ